MKEGDLSKVFVGFMGLLCVVAAGLAIYRWRGFNASRHELMMQNEILKKSEKFAREDEDFRALVAKSIIYGGDLDAVPEPVEFIEKSAREKFNMRLDYVRPKATGRRTGKLKETAMEAAKSETDVTSFCALLFYLEEAYPGGLKVKELSLQRKGPEGRWNANVVLSHFAISEE